MEPCTVDDIRLVTAADIIASRQIYVEAFQKCAARIVAIRQHDQEARAIDGR